MDKQSLLILVIEFSPTPVVEKIRLKAFGDRKFLPNTEQLIVREEKEGTTYALRKKLKPGTKISKQRLHEEDCHRWQADPQRPLLEGMLPESCIQPHSLAYAMYRQTQDKVAWLIRVLLDNGHENVKVTIEYNGWFETLEVDNHMRLQGADVYEKITPKVDALLKDVLMNHETFSQERNYKGFRLPFKRERRK